MNAEGMKVTTRYVRVLVCEGGQDRTTDSHHFPLISRRININALLKPFCQENSFCLIFLNFTYKARRIDLKY